MAMLFPTTMSMANEYFQTGDADDLGNTEPTSTDAEHQRKMKAPIVLSHEFFRDADPAEIAQRAAEATKAVCSGIK